MFFQGNPRNVWNYFFQKMSVSFPFPWSRHVAVREKGLSWTTFRRSLRSLLVWHGKRPFSLNLNGRGMKICRSSFVGALSRSIGKEFFVEFWLIGFWRSDFYVSCFILFVEGWVGGFSFWIFWWNLFNAEFPCDPIKKWVKSESHSKKQHLTGFIQWMFIVDPNPSSCDPRKQP